MQKAKTDKTKAPAVISSIVKTPDHNIELENAVIGTILLEETAFDRIATLIKETDFYSSKNEQIFRSMRQLVIDGCKIDISGVMQRLRENGDFTNDFGKDGKMTLADLTAATNSVTGSVHLEEHARMIKGMSQKRKLALITAKYHNLAFEPTEDPHDLLAGILSEVSDISEDAMAGEIKSMKSIIEATIKGMKDARNSPGDMIGTGTGFTDIDNLTLGFAAPDYIILAAGTGEGKSTAALQMAKYMGSNGEPVGFFSLEMKDKQLLWKIFSAEINEDIKTIRKGSFSQEKWNALMDRIIQLEKSKVSFYDKGGLSIIDLISILRMMKKKYGIKGAFIDYVQLLTSTGCGRKFGTREEELNFISKKIKATCMELDIWICALSQMSRIKDKRLYQKSDLRESGALEQDADGIIFIFRPNYHNIQEWDFGSGPVSFDKNDVLYLIDKWRLGETGMLRGKFIGQYNRFEKYTAGGWRPVEDGPAPRDYSEPSYDPDSPF